MKLTIILHTGPENNNTGAVIGLAKAAKAADHEVIVFIMSQGVRNLGHANFIALVECGVNITVCDHNVKQYNAAEEVAGIKYGSQYDLSGYVQDSDRVISFTK